jgi:hypothetical protein
MIPAGCQHDIAALGQPLKGGTAVDLNDALELRQVSSGAFGPVIRAVEVNPRRRLGSVPGPIITSIDPEPGGLGATAAGIEHRDRRVVGEQRLGVDHMPGEPRLQRFQPPHSATDPVGQRRAVELNTLPGEDLALAI